jgi:hypothetical protein
MLLGVRRDPHDELLRARSAKESRLAERGLSTGDLSNETVEQFFVGFRPVTAGAGLRN